MKSLKRYFLPFICVYAAIMLFYYSVSVDLGNTPLFLQARRFLPAALAFCLPFFLLRGLQVRDAWHTIILAVSYIATAPLLAYVSFHKTATILSYPFDIVFGLYLLPSLLFGQYLLSKVLSAKMTVFLMSAAELLLLLPNIFQIFYFLRFDHCLTSNGSLVIYQTNITEAAEYLHSVGLVPIACFAAFLAIGGFLFLRMNDLLHTKLKNIFLNRRKFLVVVALALPITLYAFGGAYKRIYFNQLAIDTHNYFKQVEKFKNGRKDILAELQVSLKNNDNGTIVLVIGESATRNYMSAFTDMADNTTPWLKKNKDNSQFILFHNAYSCAWNTVPALEHALTDADFYNNLAFNKAVSIIDIAKKAGYKTYWFSNQGTIGSADTPITLVAETADVSRWTCEDTSATSIQYDEVLLKYLKEVNPQEKNFIILHLMGSHIDYNNRYPEAFQKWTDPGETGRLADYKNSVLYTDYVLERFFMQTKQDLPLNAFVYCSDHGTDPNRRRDPDESGFVVLRIPMFVYLSEQYISKNPEEYANLTAHSNAYWSNDLLYDMLCGIMRVESNHVTDSNSLASQAYKYNKEDVKTALGKKWVKDDKYLR